jgi:hypothetical protein
MPKRLLEYGKRLDGTSKGRGFLGELKRPDGKVSTELSIGVEMDGEENLIPSLVPGLDDSEVKHLLGGGKTTPEILRKAVDHARRRKQVGLSPFHGEEEE